ncbi:MAG: HAD-IIA family hydrolase [Oscillospiraceae bacterium]
MPKNDIFKNTKYFIIDMDGTFYLDGNIIEGSLEFLEHLKKNNIGFCFFTNNSSNDVNCCSQKLKKMGYDAEKEKIIISSHVTIDFLKEKRKNKSVFLLGNERLTRDFLNADINLVSENPDIVVLGFDTTLTYQKMWQACKFISNGAEYIATHPDFNCPTADGFMPDTGSMMAFFKASTGKEPMVMGKPNSYTVDFLTKKLYCKKDVLCFVGDRLETDIAIGQNNNIPSVLVLTGVTTKEMYEGQSIKASLVAESLNSLCSEI